MKPARVLQLVAAPVASPAIGVNGPELRALRLLDGWRARGIEPIVAYPRRGRLWDSFRASGAKVVDFEIGGKLRFARITRIARLARGHRATVVHSQGPASLDAFAVVAARLAGCRAIVTRPSMLEHKSDLARGRRSAYAAIDRRFVRRADRVVAVSEAGWRHLSSVTGVEPDRLALVRNGVDLARFPEKQTTRSGTAPVIGMAGQLTAPKAWPDFLAMVATMRAQGVPLRALVIGDGPLRSELESWVRERKLGGTVSFAGHVEDVSELLRTLDVFVLTSHREGLPMAVLEAMASGLPIVSTDVGGLRELVVDGENGFVVAPGDVSGLAQRTSELLRSPDACVRLGRASRQRAERLFSEASMADGYASLYRELAESPGDAR